MNRSRIPLAFAAMLVLGACAGSDTQFPSLAPRAVEKAPPNPDAPAVAAPLGDADPALSNRLGELVAAVRSGDAAFAKARTVAESAIGKAQGGAIGGEAWLSAQQALSALDAARGPVQQAQADLDALAIERAQGTAPSYAADQSAITAAKDVVDSTEARETAAVTVLSAKLPQP